MSQCALCEEVGYEFRRCTFGTKTKDICLKCLGQWKIGSEGHIVLEDRNVGEKRT